jgi:two-component sensor histidine kinase
MKWLYDYGDQSLPVRFLSFCKWMREKPAVSVPISLGLIVSSFALQWFGSAHYIGAPFLTLYPAVVLASLWSNLYLGVVALAVLGGAQWYFFIGPNDPWAIATYAFDGALCTLLIDFVNRSFDVMNALIEREKRYGHKHYVVAHEMRHRVQNLFAVVQGVVRMSFRGSGPVDRQAYRNALLDRLQGMADANRAITDHGPNGVPLREIIANETNSFRRQFMVGGNTEHIVLDSQMVQNISLILHELITNAVKYGALSVPTGNVLLRTEWHKGTLRFIWRECGGPSVTKPKDGGFGSRLLDSFAKRFAKDVYIDYAPDGPTS